MEYLDLYDENRKPLGRKVLRSKDMKLEDGEYINIVIVFIENSEGKFLIQKTSKEKGSVFATTGGLVKSGYTPDLTEHKPHVFQDVYYMKKDLDINSLKLQKEEVEYVVWLSKDEINSLISEDKFRKGNIEGFNYVMDNNI